MVLFVFCFFRRSGVRHPVPPSIECRGPPYLCAPLAEPRGSRERRPVLLGAETMRCTSLRFHFLACCALGLASLAGCPSINTGCPDNSDNNNDNGDNGGGDNGGGDNGGDNGTNKTATTYSGQATIVRATLGGHETVLIDTGAMLE